MAKQRVVLIAVYNERMQASYEEIGMCYIAGLLREKGYDIMLMSSDYSKLNYDKITAFQPDIIGMPVYDISRTSVYHVCKKIKELLPDVKICAGGYSATYYSSEILNEAPFIDYAIKGEGELTWLSLLQHLEGNGGLELVKGLAFRENGRVVENEEQELIEDINILPFPERDILKDNRLKIAQISTSRGCTGLCTFCCSNRFWKKWRGRESKNIVDEIEYVINNYNITSFDFIDGSFEDPGINYKRVYDIANSIIDRGLSISYYANIRATFSKRADDNIMDTLKKSGLCGAFIGFEAANEFDLNLYKKFAGVEDNNRISQIFQKYNIIVEPGFINFNPYSTFKGIKQNVNFLEKYGYADFIYRLTSRYKVFRGTSLTAKIERDGLIESGRYDENDRYEFIDKRIGELAYFSDEIVTSMNSGNGVFIRHRYYSTVFRMSLANIKRYLERNQNEKAYSLVADIEAQVNQILLQLNRSNCTWFRSLMNLAENQWDRNEALKLTEVHLCMEEINRLTNDLEKKKSKLYFGLVRLGVPVELLG